jgi:hypothetical protein
MKKLLVVFFVLLLISHAFSLSFHGLAGSEFGGLNRQFIGAGVGLGNGLLRLEVNAFLPVSSLSDVPDLDWKEISVLEIDPMLLLNIRLAKGLAIYLGGGPIILADIKAPAFIIYSDRIFHVKGGASLMLGSIRIFAEAMTSIGLIGGPIGFGWSGIYSIHVGAGLVF